MLSRLDEPPIPEAPLPDPLSEPLLLPPRLVLPEAPELPDVPLLLPAGDLSSELLPDDPLIPELPDDPPSPLDEPVEGVEVPLEPAPRLGAVVELEPVVEPPTLGEALDPEPVVEPLDPIEEPVEPDELFEGETALLPVVE